MNKKGLRKQKTLTGYKKECVEKSMEKYDEYMYVEYYYNMLEYPIDEEYGTKIKEKYKGKTPKEAVKFYYENNSVIRLETKLNEYGISVPILPENSIVDFKSMVKIGDHYFIDIVKLPKIKSLLTVSKDEYKC